MTDAARTLADEPVRVTRPDPDREIPVLIDSPHSGEEEPDEARFSAPKAHWRRSADLYVDVVFADAPRHGATLIAARFPRVFIDPNRATDDIDPDWTDGSLPFPVRPSQRARDGWGLCWTSCGPENLPLYDRLLSFDEIVDRIDRYWRPYQTALEAELARLHDRFGYVLHLNAHSMAWAVSARDAAPRDRQRPDFDLGNCHGTSCAQRLTDGVAAHLRDAGHAVDINGEFSGGYIVRWHGNPGRGVHSLQIEINRKHLLEADRSTRSRSLAEMRDGMSGLVSRLGSLSWPAEGSLGSSLDRVMEGGVPIHEHGGRNDGDP